MIYHFLGKPHEHSLDPPLFKEGGVNFDYLPRREGNLKIKKRWRYGAGAGLLERGARAGTFPI